VEENRKSLKPNGLAHEVNLFGEQCDTQEVTPKCESVVSVLLDLVRIGKQDVVVCLKGLSHPSAWRERERNNKS
jgi:hypothetical protein